ncbi:zinc finger protein [Aphelenchoides avenae]|nr:zinc finger protein [Aphelenchus avenae]
MTNIGKKNGYHPPDHTDPAASHSVAPQARFAAFTDSYVEFVGRNKSADQPFTGYFKCTYENCGLRLPTNVTFMVHLWAHVVHFKPHYEDDDVANLPRALSRTMPENKDREKTKDDEYRLCICPECLLVAKSPWRMQMHYHLVHKRHKAPGITVCNVCEQTVQTEDFDAHVCQKHEDSNAPFSCKKCRYRTSMRCALLKHFTEEHCGSSMMLCPFCALAFDIPEDERDRPVATVTSYVHHMLQHSTERNVQCYSKEDHARCSAKFSEHSTDKQIKWHVREHKESVPRSWDEQTKSYASLLGNNHSEVRQSGMSQRCTECSGVFRNPQEHFQEVAMACDAKDCHYSTTCKRSYALHRGLSTCRPENLKRLGRANLSTEREPELVVFECFKDGFKTTSSRDILQHSLRCAAEFGIVRSRDAKVDKQSTPAFIGKDEHSIFAPRGSKPPEVSDTSPPQAGVAMKRKLHDLLPPHMVPVAAGNSKMMKTIFDELDTSTSKELHMRLTALTRVNAIQRDSSTAPRSRKRLKPARSGGTS